LLFVTPCRQINGYWQSRGAMCLTADGWHPVVLSVKLKKDHNWIIFQIIQLHVSIPIRIIIRFLHKHCILKVKRGYTVVQLVEALRYKPEGRGFDSRLGHWLNPSSRIMAQGLTQSVVEMSTRRISCGVKAAGA
jgi:hypothetical protein